MPEDILPTVDRFGSLNIAIDPGAGHRARLARSSGSLRFRRDDSTHVDLDVSLTRKDRLVLADADYPGWSISVDGRERRGVGHGIIRTVPLGSGRHLVAFDYSPMSYRLGLFLTLVSLATVAARWSLVIRS